MNDTDDKSQQERTIAQLEHDGWVVVPQSDKAIEAEDGSVLMQLMTPAGVSHIIVMLNGDRVDARQKLGKQSARPVP